MKENQAIINAFNYSSGKEYMEKIKYLLGTSTDSALAARFNVPKGTISTWLRRDMTPFEISIRTHLATGVSLRWLLLDEGDPFEKEEEKKQTETISLTKEILNNGEIIKSDSIIFDLQLLVNYNLDPVMTKLISQDNELLLIDTSKKAPTSGRYLINIDGSISINHLQRLPGKKLAMSFGDSSIEIAQEDIEVIGRVVMVMEKE